jgi:glycosyltransferase involved in cell wall biosynthesis
MNPASSRQRSNAPSKRALHVVLIAFHYPPDASVGSVRAAKVARALAEQGHRVDVVAPDLGLREHDRTHGITVHRVRHLRSFPEWWAAFRGRRKTAAGAAEPAAHRTMRNGAGASLWQRFILSFLLLPDNRVGFVPAAMLKVLRLCSPNTVLYTTGPPFSTHIVGWFAWAFKRPWWVAEYRDPWTFTEKERLRSAPADRVHTWLRERCLCRADAVVAVTEALASTLSARRTAAGRPAALVVRNGVDSEHRVAPGERGPGARRIGYFGHLYLGRDPRPFLRALARLRRDGALQEPVIVDFYGDCEHYGAVSIVEEVTRCGLSDCVIFHGDRPRADCLAAMAECDLLLLLAQKQPTQVPNKLYEYLGAGRPIIAFADTEGESAAMLRMLGGHYVIDAEDDARVATIFERALQASREPFATDERLLRAWSTERQMALLVDFLAARRIVPGAGGRYRPILDAAAEARR